MERRFEIRTETDSSARVISGTAILYNHEASLPWSYERFAPGAFGGNVANSDIILNRQHSRAAPLARTGAGLELFDSPESLSFRATLADTQDGRDTYALVKSGIMRGASIEFHEIDSRISRERDKPLVEVLEAKLVGLSLVDSGAYPTSVISAREARVRELANGAQAIARRRVPMPTRAIFAPGGYGYEVAFVHAPAKARIVVYRQTHRECGIRRFRRAHAKRG